MARSNSGGNGKAKKVTRVRKPVGVLAPGARFNSSTGKITPPKKSAPKRSGVFARGLPAPIPQAPKGLVSSPRVTKVTPSGQRSVDRYTKGTVEWNLAHALAKTPVATTRRQLEREERRQERLIKSVTGKPRQVELRTGVWTGGKVQRFEGTALGSPGKGRSPSIIQGNLASRDPQIVKAQKTALAQQESVRAGLESNALNERKLPFRKGYKSPGPPALQAAKVPGVLKPRAGVALPKRDPRKSRLAQRMNENIARKELRVLKSKKKPIARRAKAADNLRELKIISGESERQAKVRKLREARQAVAEGNRVSFDSGYKTKGPGGAIRAVGGVAKAVVKAESEVLDPNKLAANIVKYGPGIVKAEAQLLPSNVAKRAAPEVKKIAAKIEKDPIKAAKDTADLVVKVAAGGAIIRNPSLAFFNINNQKQAAKAARLLTGKGFKVTPENIRKAGFDLTPVEVKAVLAAVPGGLGNLAKVPVYSAEAIANDPETQTKRFIKDAAEMIKSIPAGVIMAVDKGPETVWQQLKKDYVRRYGALTAGRDKEFRDRLKKEGVTSEVLDSFAAISIVGGSSSKVLQAAATAGKGTGLARRIATRTVVKDGRLVARKLGDRELLPSGNFYGNVARKVIDDRRGRGVAKRQRLHQEAYAKKKRGEKLTPAERRNLEVSTKDENTTIREGGSTPIRTGTPRPAAAADLPKIPGKVSVVLTPASIRAASTSLTLLDTWEKLGLKTRFPYTKETTPREHFSQHTDNLDAQAAVSLSHKIDLKRSEMGEALPKDRGVTFMNDGLAKRTPGGKAASKGPVELTLTRREAEMLYRLQENNAGAIRKKVDEPINPLSEMGVVASGSRSRQLYPHEVRVLDGFLGSVAERMVAAGSKSGAKKIQDFVNVTRKSDDNAGGTIEGPQLTNPEMAAFGKAQREVVDFINKDDGTEFYKKYGVPERFVARDIKQLEEEVKGETLPEGGMEKLKQALVDDFLTKAVRADQKYMGLPPLGETAGAAKSARLRGGTKAPRFTGGVKIAEGQDKDLNVAQSAFGRTEKVVKEARGREAHVEYLAQEMGLTPETLSLIDAVTGRAEADAGLSVFNLDREANYRLPLDEALLSAETLEVRSGYSVKNLGGMTPDEALRSIQAIKDYFSSYLYYGTINNTLRSGVIDPDRIVGLTKTWDSNIVTEADLVGHLNDLIRMVNERGGQFHEAPIPMTASRVLPRNAELRVLNADGSESPFFFGTDELKPGMVFADRGFTSTSIGLGDKAPWNNTTFLAPKLTEGPADTAIIVEVPKGTPAIWNPETWNPVASAREKRGAEGGDLQQGDFGQKSGENEVVLAPGMRLEFIGFRKPDELVAELEMRGETGRNFAESVAEYELRSGKELKFWQRAVANHDLEQRYASGDVAAPAGRQQWKGVPVFRVVEGSGNEKIPYFKRPALSEGSLAKKRAASQAEIDRLTPIVDKQRADVKPLTKRERRKEDTRLGRQAESVSTIFDNAFIGEKSYTRRAVAKISSHEFVAMRLAQKNLDKMFRRELKILSQEEKDAFFYAMSLGIRTPEQARKVLPAWRDRILSERKASEAGRTEAQINRGPLWTNFNEVPKIEALIANPEAAFTPALARFTDIAYKEARRTGKLDPALNRFQMALRERNVQGQQLGVKIEDYAVDAANPTKAEQQNWLRAVEIARKEQGLSAGGFFRGEMRNRQQYAVHAVGGSQAVLPDKQFKGILAKYGAGNTDPEVFVRGLMSNIKRAHNWNKVALVYDAVASKLYRNMSMDEIMAAVDAGYLDPSTFALWNPRKYRIELDGIDNQIADAARYSPEGGRELGMGPSEGRIDVAHPEDGQATVHEALSAATLDGRTAMSRYAQDPSQFADAKWTVVPKGAHKEIMATTKPSNAVLRGLGIAQGKFSRVLLANPVWLQFQIASNAFLTGLVDGTGPVAIIKAQKWWYGLPPEVRNAVEPHVGIHRWYDDQNKLGAAEIPGGDIGVGRMSLNGLVDAYRGLKETPYWNANNNPLTLMFRADNAQNNFFRRAVLYNSVKREAYRNMGRDMGQIKRIQAQVMDSLKGSLGDKEAMLKLLTNQKSLERHAEHLDSLLGNWMTYTNAERRVFSRFTMFYGFLRFSTKLTFYTMPIHHPVMSSILAKLGQLQRDELRKLFGVDVPFWEIGNYYGTDGWLVPKGMRLQAARINPFFNAYGVFLGATRERPAQPGEPSFKIKSPKGTQTYATKPEWKGLLSDNMLADMTQFMPPYFGMALDQVSQQKTSFGRKPWTVNGNPAQQFGAESTVSGSDAAQVLFNDLLNLSPYWRALEQSGIPGVVKPLRGKQTSDSSILFPNPVQYAGTTKASRALMKKNQILINREGRKYQDTIAGTLFSPVLGTEGQSKIDSARSYAKDQANKTKKKKKAKKAKLWTVPK